MISGSAVHCSLDDFSERSQDTDDEVIGDPPLYPKSAGFVFVPSREVHINGFGFDDPGDAKIYFHKVFDGAFGLDEQGRTTAARIFYSFVPAKKNSEQKPVFVFLNGGPGAATSTALCTWGTGPYTLS